MSAERKSRASGGQVRLQKILSAAGVASRRVAETLIVEGRVTVNGETVAELGAKADPSDDIRVDGRRVRTQQPRRYVLLYKPVHYVTTRSDPQKRPTVLTLLGPGAEGLYPVGRLDFDSEGLILLTNDGELAHRLAHPSYEVPKTYLAEVTGPVPRRLGSRLRAGVELEDGVVAVDSFRIVGRAGPRVMVEVVLHEGRKHVVRRLLEAVGHPVRRLVRTRIGPVTLGELRSGKTRPLSREEVGALYREVGL